MIRCKTRVCIAKLQQLHFWWSVVHGTDDYLSKQSYNGLIHIGEITHCQPDPRLLNESVVGSVWKIARQPRNGVRQDYQAIEPPQAEPAEAAPGSGDNGACANDAHTAAADKI